MGNQVNLCPLGSIVLIHLNDINDSYLKVVIHSKDAKLASLNVCYQQLPSQGIIRGVKSIERGSTKDLKSIIGFLNTQ